MVICIFYRRDGRWGGMTYPSGDTKGFTALVNRWCLLPAAPPVRVEPQADQGTVATT